MVNLGYKKYQGLKLYWREVYKMTSAAVIRFTDFMDTGTWMVPRSVPMSYGGRMFAGRRAW